jgi:hypothetical protein
MSGDRVCQGYVEMGFRPEIGFLKETRFLYFGSAMDLMLTPN